MFETPITVIEQITDQIIKDQNAQIENEIMRTVRSYGINVDKEELIKALRNERDQYNKGYADGAREFAERLQSRCIEQQGCLYASDIGAELKEMAGDDNARDPI